MLIRTRLRLNSGIILTMMLVVAFFLAWSIREASRTEEGLALVTEVQKIAVERTVLRDEYLLNRSERARLQWSAKTDRLRGLLKGLKVRFPEASNKMVLENIQGAFDKTVSIFLQLVEVYERGTNIRKDGPFSPEGGRRLVEQIVVDAHALIDNTNGLQESAQRAAAAARSKSITLVSIFVSIAVIATIGNTSIISRLITARIATLRTGSANIGAGNLDHRIEVRGNDELSDLARANNEMAAKLKESHTSIEKLNEEITERKRAEEALGESEDKFKYLFEYSTIGISLTSPSGGIQVNRAFCEMLGYSQGELLDSTWQEVTHPDDIEATRSIVDSIFSGEKDSERFMKKYIHKNGSTVWADVSTSARRDNSGRPLYLMTAAMDITNRKRAEEEILRLNAELEQRVRERTIELESTNKELEAFSYSVSHDLRAPLRGIDGWSQALVEDYGDKLDEQARQYLSRVHSETQLMGVLIDDILKLSRVTRSEMRVMTVDLTDMADSIAARLRKENLHRRIDFVIQPKLKAEGDRRFLEVALSNLLDNAVKFTGPCPEARIEFGETEDHGKPVFFVRDNGVGFDMTYADKLFGAFQRLHKASEFPGTGIGLATVQRIIHRHGGRIWAEAEAGKGATFYFTLKEGA